MNPWLAGSPQDGRARLRLFCFPYAGGGSSIFRTWPKCLPETIAVCPVELPGRGARLREAPRTRLADLVGEMAEGLSPYLDRPFAFFGHSMGALLGFELARTLRRMGGPLPRHLFVSGHRAPQIPDPGPHVHALPEPAFVAELRRLGGTPPAVLEHEELMQLLLPILRADFALVETYAYAPESPLSCPITALGGREDPEAGPGDLAAWRDQTTGDFSLRMLPGDHFFVHTAQPLLLAALSHALQTA